MSYVYVRSEPHLYTVGFYDPDGRWHSESDHISRDDAAAKVHYLNGGREFKGQGIEHVSRRGGEDAWPNHHNHCEKALTQLRKIGFYAETLEGQKREPTGEDYNEILGMASQATALLMEAL